MILLACRDYGGALVFAAGIFILFLMLLKWVLKQQEKILCQANDERVSWQKLHQSLCDAITRSTIQAQEFQRSVHEAHRFQREEHKEILDGFRETNVSFREISRSLGEVEKALGRINGYKD